MEKYLITGFSGFVSRHFLNFLEAQEIPVLILGLDIHEPEFDFTDYKTISCSFVKVDLLNKEKLNETLLNFLPDYILHLASYSSVAYSWEHPVTSFTNNTNIFLNVVECIRKIDLKCRILSVGSSEEYGQVSANDLPLKEDHLLNPISPYAVARVSQELLSKVFVKGYGMDIILTRSFNHIGPGQKAVFVVSSFAQKLVAIKKKQISSNELRTGDLSLIRDFVDVRDVVRAYYLLFREGKKGEIYNICSGKGISLEEVLGKMIKIANVEIRHISESGFFRPDDNRIIIGSNEKIKRDVGWINEIGLEKSLNDVLAFFLSQ